MWLYSLKFAGARWGGSAHCAYGHSIGNLPVRSVFLSKSGLLACVVRSPYTYIISGLAYCVNPRIARIDTVMYPSILLALKRPQDFRL
jgi:hypothetical protein